MANQMYGYSSASYGGAANYTSRSIGDQYLPGGESSFIGSSRYFGSDTLPSQMSSYSSLSDRGGPSSMLFSNHDTSYSPASARIGGGALTPAVTQALWPPGVDVGTSAASVDSLFATLKRSSSEALYHQTVLGAHNTTGQSEAWYSTNPSVKRPRFESASNLPIYPQRPGEKDCAHYMLTRTCKFGDSCKFDHPIWVPEGGIPDWKEVPVDAVSESLPERPGEPDCPYFLKTQRCKFGLRCKFNHPTDKTAPLCASVNAESSSLPDRPSEPPCAFYLKTGKCKFGSTCKFHHPRDISIPSDGQENGSCVQIDAVANGTTGDLNLPKPSFTTALLHNSKGLPIRLGEVDCPFYLKTGSCKYGATCRYNHPDRLAINPPIAVAPSPGANLNIGLANPAASVLQAIDPRLTQAMFGFSPTFYPQRPGQVECDFYMKTGECKFGEKCKFHHPIDRSAHTLLAKESHQQNIKLTMAGLPRREGAINCPYYMKTGACKYGATCKFDHPPPGEVMAVATSQGASTSNGGGGEGEGKDDQKVAEAI